MLKCPHCEEVYKVEMPTDRCVVLFICPSCGKTIVPKNGDCCVFCSYADKKCPGKQEEGMKNV